MQTIDTLLVDDHAEVRRSIAAYLTNGTPLEIEIIGQAESGQEAITKAHALRPDLMIIDVRMPDINGLEVTQQLKDDMPRLKVIMLTPLRSALYAKAAIASGADGYVTKSLVVEKLALTIQQVMQKVPSPEPSLIV